MLVYLKTNGGLDVKTESGKVVSLKGGGVVNNIADTDFKEIAQNHAVSQMLEKGYIVASSKKTDNVSDDLKSENVSKQNKEKSDKVKVEKASAEA